MRRLNKSYIDRIYRAFYSALYWSKTFRIRILRADHFDVTGYIKTSIIAYAILLFSYNNKTLYDAYGGTFYFRSLRPGLIAHVNPTIN